MTKHTKPPEPSAMPAEGTGAGTSVTGVPVDVSPEAIAALVAEGASALGDVALQPDASPDALPLLVGITHDLRSPLSSMLVLIERLRAGHAGPLTPLQEKQLGLLYSAAFGMAALTNDALDMARGAVRDISTTAPSVFSVGEMFRSIRGLIQPIAEEKQLLVRWSGLQDDLRIGRAAPLYRVLLNLVTNALKYTDTGSVTVMAEDLGSKVVRFTVSDSGQGLPASVRARLRISGSGQSMHSLQSSGLGLAMCQHFLEAMDSRLEETTMDGVTGTTLRFDLFLPAAGGH